MTQTPSNFPAVPAARKRGFLLAGFCVLACVLQLALPVFAHAASISESFSGSADLVPGMLVSTDPGVANGVTAATLANSNYLVGAVQAEGSALVSFTNNGATVSVATMGVVSAYVTSANGEVKKGDYIGPSWLNGVGMRVAEGDNHKVLGVALEDFDSSSATDFKDISLPGGKKTVKVGSVALRLFGTPSKLLTSNQSGVSSFVAKLAGHEVTYIRIAVAAVLFIFTLLLAGVFIKSSISRSFLALGRNPLASHSIYGSLTQISFVSMAIILLGTAVAYAVVVI